MTTKYKVIIAIAALLVAFAFGRFSGKQVASVATDTHKTTDTTTHKDKDTHTTTKTVTQKNADGSETTTTTTDTTTEAHTDKKSDTTVDKQKTITYNKPQTTTVSGLAGIDIHTKQPVYGGAISRSIVGPISVGVWGLSNGSGGVSVGISF